MFLEWPKELLEAYPPAGMPIGGHPGIRVGQTWALMNGPASVFAITEYDEQHETFIDGKYRMVESWFCGGTWISDLELRNLIGPVPGLPLGNAYLLSDAACPWLAPWSPKWPARDAGPLPPYRLTASNTAGIWDVIAIIEEKEVYIGRLHRVGEAWYPSTYGNEPLSAVPFYQVPAVHLLFVWWNEQAELSDKLLGPGHRPGVCPTGPAK